MSQARLSVASSRQNFEETHVVRDELPPLEQGEIRLRVDKVGLSANNRFYANSGEQRFLNFFSIYPLLSEEHKELANVPAWGVGTIVETRNEDFQVGEHFWGFFHMTNYVQMKAKRHPGNRGFRAYGGMRNKAVSAYNTFSEITETSPLFGENEKADFACAAFPGAFTGWALTQLLLLKNFYKCDGLVVTSASSKLSLAMIQILRQKDAKKLKYIVGYTSPRNKEFVESTGLYDVVLSYDEDLPTDMGNNNFFMDVAGNSKVYKAIQGRLSKGLVIGDTQPGANSSLGLLSTLGWVKLVSSMVAPKTIAKFLDKHLNPKLEMFFVPTVLNELKKEWGNDKFVEISNRDMEEFTDTVVRNEWITVCRADKSVEDVQKEFKRVFLGDELKPTEAVVVSLANL